ncbi:MAG: hypothetical protein LBT59_01465, partial [Clostridiales bacterium]|nr:hypothetical protein [Clostridiales bacterium]
MGFSDLELVERWEAQREIKNFMGKYVNSLLLGREAKMFDKFWSDREDVSLGTNSGAYVGPEAIKGYYKAQHGKDALIASILKKRFAERLEGKTETELHGIGTFKAKPLVCPIIEVAGDGLAAKGLWLCQGAYADVYSYGPSSNWTWGHISADFVKEGDGFRLWHLECLDDVDCRCGTTWTSDTSGTSGSSWSSWTSWTSQTSQASWTYSDKLPDLPEFKELAKFELPEPNVKAQARSLYTPKRPLPPPPKFPEPYAFSDEAANSFSSGDSDSVLIRRVWDVESIKTLMHKRSCLIAGDRRREILESLWVSGEEARRTASYGGNWGWHVGFPAIWDHWVLEHEAWLEEQRVRNGFDSVNVGNMYAQPVSTGLVELAGDGKTAKGMWYSIGQETLALPDGKAEARWILAK